VSLTVCSRSDTGASGQPITTLRHLLLAHKLRGPVREDGGEERRYRDRVASVKSRGSEASGVALWRAYVQLMATSNGFSVVKGRSWLCERTGGLSEAKMDAYSSASRCGGRARLL
jgi:hypothetical protein